MTNQQRIAEALQIKRSGVVVGDKLHYVLELHDWMDALPERIERALRAAAQHVENELCYGVGDDHVGAINAGIEALK